MKLRGLFYYYSCILGVISGVLTMPTFPSYFGIVGDAAYIASKKGDIVSMLQAGCCVGALLSNFFSGMYHQVESSKQFT